MGSKEKILLIIVLLIAAFLRFFNLMHDEPYFFNPDERNMGNAISQFRVPNNLIQIPSCIFSQFFPQNDPGSSITTNCNLNPHFFAYGQFPLYLAFVSDQLFKLPIGLISQISQIQPPTHNPQLTTTFSSSIFWLRFWSALSSTLTVLLIYLIAKFLIPASPAGRHNSKFSILAALLAAFSPGLIQSAHFGTTESLLTFFFMVTIYLSIVILNPPTGGEESRTNVRKFFIHNSRFIILNSFVIGLALGSKLTGIFFFIPPAISLMIRTELLKKNKKKLFIGLPARIATQSVAGGLVFIGSILIFILSSPYNLVEPENFKSAVFGYEQDVATGRYEAFYTRQFVNTTPILFQAEKIFPYTLGWPVFILGSIGFLLMSISLFSKLIQTIAQSIKYQVLRIRYKKIKNKNILNTYYVILTTSFIVYLLPNAFLFAKWTRFMTPILPFFAIFAAFALQQIYHLLNNLVTKAQSSRLKAQSYNLKLKTFSFNLWFYALRFTLYALLILPGIAFMSIYFKEDTRVTASKWIYQKIPNNSYVLSETANVVDIPLGLPNNLNTYSKNYEVISFDFYHLDENPLLFTQLIDHLSKADYIFIPSRRIFANYPKLPKKYPLVTKYYQLLFSGALGFEKIAEISSLPDENAEETFTIFDHPVIRIYRKVKLLTIDKYRLLFEN